jgi:thiol-disulfide isomerase/thioredoxin
MLGMMPDLSTDDVQRFVALGEAGKVLLRSGETAKAEAAFRAQIALFPANADPYVALAMSEAARGAEKEAIEHLRAAVARGFFDLSRIERAETAVRLRKSMAFLQLQEAVPALVEKESRFAGWSDFRVQGVPENVATTIGKRAALNGKIDRMAPALGARLVRLWKKAIDRATAAFLEEYIAKKPEASDLAEALDRLMDLYAGGSLLRWEPPPADAARRLRDAANIILERFPQSPMRPGALVCRALATNAERDAEGVLPTTAAGSIRSALDEVLSRYPDSPFAATAVEGLVRLEADSGRIEAASSRYRAFVASHAAERAVLDDVRDRLGPLALRAGGVPDFEAPGLDGTTIGRDALRGKVAVVDFWATWCRPCVEEFPTLQKIAERYGDGVVILGINMDGAEEMDEEELLSWMARVNTPGRQLRDGRSWSSDLVRAFGVKEIPFTVVVDADGSVRAVGERGKKLEKAVQTAITADR